MSSEIHVKTVNVNFALSELKIHFTRLRVTFQRINKKCINLTETEKESDREDEEKFPRDQRELEQTGGKRERDRLKSNSG